MTTRFEVGDYVKRTKEFVLDELDADTIYFVTEVNKADEEIRIRGGNAWPNFGYTAAHFSLVNEYKDFISDQVDSNVTEVEVGGVDMVNEPPHYKRGNYEVIDVLAEFFPENPLLWQVGKYIMRAGHKNDTVEDLKKAEFYLKREIARLENL